MPANYKRRGGEEVSPHVLRHTWAAVQQTGRPMAGFWSDATRSPESPRPAWAAGCEPLAELTDRGGRAVAALLVGFVRDRLGRYRLAQLALQPIYIAHAQGPGRLGPGVE